MDRIFVGDVVKATGGELIAGSPEMAIDNVCMDSRIVTENSLFVAIPGEHTDGHKFLESAAEKGASCAIVSKRVEMPKGMAGVLVEESIYALQELSRWYMSERLSMKKIAITGSVGKTTTRDLIFAAVSSKHKAGKNERNYNSETGLPLTVMTFDKEMEVGVMEMGTGGGMDEVSRLADLVRPDVAVITNIGVSHIEHFGTRDRILEAKLGIAEYFSDENTLVINANDDKLVLIKESNHPYKIVAVGSDAALCNVDYRVTDVVELGIEGLRFTLWHSDKNYMVELPVPGLHNAINAALAIAASNAIGVSIEEAIKGMGNMSTTGSRLKIVEIGGFRIIDDSYNAAPDSMKSAISTLINGDAKRKIAVLGDMNELGEKSYEMHYSVGQFAAEKKPDIIIAVGEKAMAIADGAAAAIVSNGTNDANATTEIIRCSDSEEAFKALTRIVKEGDLILVKASRGMALDEIVQKLEAEYKN